MANGPDLSRHFEHYAGETLKPGHLYVITWRHSDGSGSGAVCTTTDPAKANALREMLEQYTQLDIRMEVVPCF